MQEKLKKLNSFISNFRTSANNFQCMSIALVLWDKGLLNLIIAIILEQYLTFCFLVIGSWVCQKVLNILVHPSGNWLDAWFFPGFVFISVFGKGSNPLEKLYTSPPVFPMLWFFAWLSGVWLYQEHLLDCCFMWNRILVNSWIRKSGWMLEPKFFTPMPFVLVAKWQWGRTTSITG